MVLITIVTGTYKPTYNWGASHCNHPPSSPSQEKKGIGHQKGHAEATECVEAALLIRQVGRREKETGKEANGNLCQGMGCVFGCKNG